VLDTHLLSVRSKCHSHASRLPEDATSLVRIISSADRAFVPVLQLAAVAVTAANRL